jgi:hypothetical protein
MRIVVTSALLLALSCGVNADRLCAGDEPSGVSVDFNFTPTSPAGNVKFNITPVVGELCRCNPPLGGLMGHADCDTSVYHLEHAHAAQVIARAKSLITQIAACAADGDVNALPTSLILLPTTSDDAIIAICPKTHVGLVSHAIKSCDALKQYAVKVQLFEVADSGKTIPVGGPHLLIGREGTVQCTMPEESVCVKFNVETPLADANTEVPPAPSDEETAATGDETSAACGAGRCYLSCTPPIGEMAVESECDGSGTLTPFAIVSSDGIQTLSPGIVHFSASCSSDAKCCSQSCSSDTKCCNQSGTSTACGGTCAACKAGTCTGECCKDGCCHGQAAGCSQANGCKCDGSCCATSHQAESTQDSATRAHLFQIQKDEVESVISNEFDNYVQKMKRDFKVASEEDVDHKLQQQGESLRQLKLEFAYRLLVNEIAHHLVQTGGKCGCPTSATACSGSCSEACGCSPECAAAQCCEAGCCQGACGVTGCHCGSSCGATQDKSPESSNYEETSTECPACQSNKHFSVGFGFGTGCPGLHLIGPIVWFNKGDEPRCAGCEAASCPGWDSQVADSDDGHDCETCNRVPPAPAQVELDCSDLPCHPTTEQMARILHDRLDVEGSPIGVQFEYDGPANLTPQEIERLAAKSVGKQAFAIDANGNCVVRLKLQAPANSAPSCIDHPLDVALDGTGKIILAPGTANCQAAQSETASSSCTDGCPGLAAGQDATLASPNAPCSCEETEDAQQAPGAEPPALLTLSQHRDPSTALSALPHWQEELLQAFRGRRLSELFEPQASQTPANHELWRLLAEFPKHASQSGHTAGHSLTIVDLPDRVRIFETNGEADSVKFSETLKSSSTNVCPSCREQFRVFLEEIFRGSDASEEISQASHREGDHVAAEARDLPSVTHSKIETTTLCYPLRDLVLCDDAGRPVFDTCSIIDHIQMAVSPETWSHPSVSMRLDQQSVSLVVTQTAEVHQKIADHLRYLRRLQVKQICNLIERMSGDTNDDAGPSAQNDSMTPTADVDLGPALPIGGK